MKKTKARVEILLRNNKELRDSDKKLLLKFWEDEGLGFSDTQKKIFMDKCTTPESVTRARRNLKDKYPASEEVDNKRFELFKQYRGSYFEEFSDVY